MPVMELGNEAAEKFYQNVLGSLLKAKIPFMVGGTYAFSAYTGIKRKTKDLDLFCKTSDYPRILQLLQDEGFKIEITDARWIAKVKLEKFFIDFIFGTAHGVVSVDDTWLQLSRPAEVLGKKVRLIAPEELIWSKSLRGGRDRYEGPDINHLILKKGARMNWWRLLIRMEPHWEILFARILEFRFVYPSERGIVPIWLLEELISRVKNELTMPLPREKVCRGTLLSREDYRVDIDEWGFKDVG